MQKPSGRTWLLSGEVVEEKSEYKYLGVQMEKTGRWNSWQQAREKAGRGTMAALWWGGARSGGLPVLMGERLMREMLLPTLCYGSEVVGATTKHQSRKLEAVQAHAGCQLLGLPRMRTAFAMVRGELGWIRMSARRDAAQLRYLHRLRSMPPSLLTRVVFDDRRQTYEQRECAHASKQKKSAKQLKAVKHHGFYSNIQRTLKKYRLTLPPAPVMSEQAAMSTDGGMRERSRRLAKRNAGRAKRAWAIKVDAAVLRREKEEWMKEICTKTTGKSPWYAAVKPEWGRERWLQRMDGDRAYSSAAGTNQGSAGRSSHNSTSSSSTSSSSVGAGHYHHSKNGAVQNSGRRWRARMRCSAGLPLAAVLHAEDALLHPSPVCTMCKAGAAENQVHVMSACSRYAGARADLMAAVMADMAKEEAAKEKAARAAARPSSSYTVQRWRDADEEERAVWLLGSATTPAVTAAVHNYLHRLFRARAAVVGERTAATAAAAATVAAAAERVVVMAASKMAKTRAKQARPTAAQAREQRRVKATSADTSAERGVTGAASATPRSARGRGARGTRGARGARGARGGKERGRGRGRGGRGGRARGRRSCSSSISSHEDAVNLRATVSCES